MTNPPPVTPENRPPADSGAGGFFSAAPKVWAVRLFGLVLLLGGLAFANAAIQNQTKHGQDDVRETLAWQEAVSQPVLAADHPGSPSAAPTNGSPAPVGQPAKIDAGDYGLLSFPSVNNLSVVMGDGDWDVLRHKAAAHSRLSPALGQEGNVVVGFHREPRFKDVTSVKAGDVVKVQDREGHVYDYKVAWTKVVVPNDASSLQSIKDGHKWLTLVTCTPWYIDSQRFIVRAELQ